MSLIMIKRVKKYAPLHPQPSTLARSLFAIYLVVMVACIAGHLL